PTTQTPKIGCPCDSEYRGNRTPIAYENDTQILQTRPGSLQHPRREIRLWRKCTLVRWKWYRNGNWLCHQLGWRHSAEHRQQRYGAVGRQRARHPVVALQHHRFRERPWQFWY